LDGVIPTDWPPKGAMVTKSPPLHIYTSSLSRRQRAWVRSRRRRALGRVYIAIVLGAAAVVVMLLVAVVLVAS
jgi:hypothetical protein